MGQFLTHELAEVNVQISFSVISFVFEKIQADGEYWAKEMLKNNAPQKALAFNIVLDGYAKYFFKFRSHI